MRCQYIPKLCSPVPFCLEKWGSCPPAPMGAPPMHETTQVGCFHGTYSTRCGKRISGEVVMFGCQWTCNHSGLQQLINVGDYQRRHNNVWSDRMCSYTARVMHFTLAVHCLHIELRHRPSNSTFPKRSLKTIELNVNKYASKTNMSRTLHPLQITFGYRWLHMRFDRSRSFMHKPKAGTIFH